MLGTTYCGGEPLREYAADAKTLMPSAVRSQAIEPQRPHLQHPDGVGIYALDYILLSAGAMHLVSMMSSLPSKGRLVHLSMQCWSHSVDVRPTVHSLEVVMAHCCTLAGTCVGTL
jgi:hypothetical protein